MNKILLPTMLLTKCAVTDSNRIRIFACNVTNILLQGYCITYPAIRDALPQRFSDHDGHKTPLSFLSTPLNVKNALDNLIKTAFYVHRPIAPGMLHCIAQICDLVCVSKPSSVPFCLVIRRSIPSILTAEQLICIWQLLFRVIEYYRARDSPEEFVEMHFRILHDTSERSVVQ